CRAPTGRCRAARSRSWAFHPIAKVDRLVAALADRPDEILFVAHLAGELGRADADERDEMRIAATDRAVTVLLHQPFDALVLALAAAAVQDFHRPHAFERRLVVVMLAKTDRRSAGVARHGDAAELLDVGDQLLRVQTDVGEIEAIEH